MLTYTGANAILNTFMQGKYVGLSTTEPGQAGSGYTEPSGNGYERVYVTNTGTQANIGQASAGHVENSAIIYFPEATGDWGTCTHFLVFTSKGGDDLVAFGALTNPITPTNEHVPIIRLGDFDLTLQ